MSVNSEKIRARSLSVGQLSLSSQDPIIWMERGEDEGISPEEALLTQKTTGIFETRPRGGHPPLSKNSPKGGD